MEPPNSTTTASEITAAKIEVPDFELPVLPSEWRRVPTATIEELLQLARWNDPISREHRRKLDRTPGYRCDVEFVMK